MELLEIDADRLTEYSADVLSEVFSFEDMEYFAGIKLFNRVNMERCLGIWIRNNSHLYE